MSGKGGGIGLVSEVIPHCLQGGGCGSSEVRFRFRSLSRSLTPYNCLLLLLLLIFLPSRNDGGPLKGVAYNIPVQLGMNVDTDPAAANHLTLVPYDQIQSSH